MKFVYNDGGRKAAGYKGNTGDCVTRAVAIASDRSYQEIYAIMAQNTGDERKSKGATARNGVHVKRKWFKDYMRSLGFEWTPTMLIGQGCKVHLVDGELPLGHLVVAVSKHYVAVIDGVIHDTHDPRASGFRMYPPNYLGNIPKGARRLENGNGWAYEPDRCVYGYWKLRV